VCVPCHPLALKTVQTFAATLRIKFPTCHHSPAPLPTFPRGSPFPAPVTRLKADPLIICNQPGEAAGHPELQCNEPTSHRNLRPTRISSALPPSRGIPRASPSAVSLWTQQELRKPLKLVKWKAASDSWQERPSLRVESRESSVGMASGYRLDGRGFTVRFPTASRSFFSPLVLVPTQFRTHLVPGLLASGVKKPGREADQSPQINTPILFHGVVLSYGRWSNLKMEAKGSFEKLAPSNYHVHVSEGHIALPWRRKQQVHPKHWNHP
jgi:hypothetical protein